MHPDFNITAILAWGSLTWDPKELNFIKDVGWKNYGPVLPIEFARISNNGRLTLVITENGTPVITYFALAQLYTKVEDVIIDLKSREGCKTTDIGYYIAATETFYPENFPFKNAIMDWAKKEGMENVVWTNLPEKWEYKNENEEIMSVNPDDRIEYLKNLPEDKKKLAEEYIRKAPQQTQTKYRSLIEKELDWTPIEVDINPQFKEALELENKLTFSKMGGIGNLSCLDCHHTESISTFIHGYDFKLKVRCATFGFQCQSCGKFHEVYHNERDGLDPIHACECGGKIENKKAVFCPKCKSHNVEFKSKIFS